MADFTDSCLVFHAIVLPVLTYSMLVWFTDQHQKSLLHMAQVAQNDALRCIAGCFWTTPVEPLHHLLAIPPIHYTLCKLHASYGDQLTHLPPKHALCTIVQANIAALWLASLCIPSLLLLLTPAIFPLYYAAALPYVWTWVNPWVSLLFSSPPSLMMQEHTRTLIQSPSGLCLLVQLIPHSDLFISSFLLFRGLALVGSESWTFSAAIVTPSKRKVPTSLVALSEFRTQINKTILELLA